MCGRDTEECCAISSYCTVTMYATSLCSKLQHGSSHSSPEWVRARHACVGLDELGRMNAQEGILTRSELSDLYAYLHVASIEGVE